MKKGRMSGPVDGSGGRAKGATPQRIYSIFAPDAFTTSAMRL